MIPVSSGLLSSPLGYQASYISPAHLPDLLECLKMPQDAVPEYHPKFAGATSTPSAPPRRTSTISTTPPQPAASPRRAEPRRPIARLQGPPESPSPTKPEPQPAMAEPRSSWSSRATQRRLPRSRVRPSATRSCTSLPPQSSGGAPALPATGADEVNLFGAQFGSGGR